MYLPNGFRNSYNYVVPSVNYLYMHASLQMFPLFSLPLHTAKFRWS